MLARAHHVRDITAFDNVGTTLARLSSVGCVVWHVSMIGRKIDRRTVAVTEPPGKRSPLANRATGGFVCTALLFAFFRVEHIGAENILRSSRNRRAFMPAFVPKQ